MAVMRRPQPDSSASRPPLQVTLPAQGVDVIDQDDGVVDHDAASMMSPIIDVRLLSWRAKGPEEPMAARGTETMIKRGWNGTNWEAKTR